MTSARSARSARSGRSAGPAEAVEILTAIADPMRQELLARLVESGPATATELAVELPVTRQAVAKQLAVLSRSGLVSRERHGRDVRFTAQPDALARTASWLERLAADWHDRLAAIKQIGATPE